MLKRLPNQLEFLEEYKKLCEKYNLFIDAMDDTYLIQITEHMNSDKHADYKSLDEFLQMEIRHLDYAWEE